MLECLVEHGCLDLTTAINQQATSPGLIIGGGFGDIYGGKLRNGTNIAIKVWRFVTATESEGKSLKVCNQKFRYCPAFTVTLGGYSLACHARDI